MEFPAPEKAREYKKEQTTGFPEAQIHLAVHHRN
jgi:hypothetical protein